MSVEGPVLVTGGAGFIGSHTCKMLSSRNIEVIIYDNLSTGRRENLKWGTFFQGDLHDRAALDLVFNTYRPKSVVHFAAAAYVGESVADPLKYYSINVIGTANLLSSMLLNGVQEIVFSSTCATYGIPDLVPIDERCPQSPVNPYGNSKLAAEKLIRDCCAAYGLRAVLLRYFNAAGADPDGELGEYHSPETHLIPRCLQAAAGLIPAIELYGVDYDTPDGSCIRDYIHVSDLADGHLAALEYLADRNECTAINLGTGIGYSVFEIMHCVEKVVGRRVPHIVRDRRAGDPPVLLANNRLSKSLLAFNPKRSCVENIVRTAWRQYELDKL